MIESKRALSLTLLASCKKQKQQTKKQQQKTTTTIGQNRHFFKRTIMLVGQRWPWYNRNGWLGVKHQVTYLLIGQRVLLNFLLLCFDLFSRNGSSHLCFRVVVVFGRKKMNNSKLIAGPGHNSFRRIKPYYISKTRSLGKIKIVGSFRGTVKPPMKEHTYLKK